MVGLGMVVPETRIGTIFSSLRSLECHSSLLSLLLLPCPSAPKASEQE